MTTAAWHLNSNSGRDSVTWHVRGTAPGRDGSLLLCDVRLAGQYFGAALSSGTSELRDYSLDLKGLGVGVPELDRLCSFLQSWLQLPLSDQAASPLAIECNVGGLFDQSLVLLVGQRADILSDRKPVATLRYLTGSMKGEMVFVTDQSCLRQLADGIREAVDQSAQ